MIDQLKSGFTWLYLAAKLRQLRAIAADPASSPAQVTAATRELTKLADSLYRGPEAGPSALIARLEREGIEAAERILPGRTDAPFEPEIGYVYDVRFPDKPGLGTARVRVLGLADGGRAINGRRLARVEMILGRLPKAGESAGAGPCDTVAIIIDEAAWTPVSEVSWRIADALLDACRAFRSAFSESGEFNSYTSQHSPAELRQLADEAIKLAESGGIGAVRKSRDALDGLLKACQAAVAATRDESDPANLPHDVLDQMEWAIAEATKGGVD